MHIHHIGPEYISENISSVISGKTSPDMDIHHIGPEHISENIFEVYLQNNISGHGYTSHWSRAYLQKYLWSYLWKNISRHGYTSHWTGAYLQKYLWSVSPEYNIQTWIY